MSEKGPSFANRVLSPLQTQLRHIKGFMLKQFARLTLHLQGRDDGIFQLARFFSIASLVTILIAALLLSWMYRVIAIEDLRSQGEQHNQALTQAFSNAIWPQMQYLIDQQDEGISRGRQQRTHILQYKTLHDSIIKLTTGTSILNIRIHDTNNRVIYSGKEEEVGTILDSDYPGAQTARDGTVSTRIDHHDFFGAFDGLVKERWILLSYMPMRSPLSGEIKGVFEVHADVTELYKGIAQSRNRFALTVTGILTLVYLILFVLVRHADMIIRRQASDREKYLDRIKQINANLDRTARELAIAHDEAVEANSAKSQFLANMSHELRTPLNAIIGYSEMLVEDLEPRNETEIVDDLKKIQNAGKHLLAVINEILDLSKIEAGRIELHIEPFDIFDVVHGVAATIQPLATRNSNVFDLECPDTLGTMHSDLTRLRQILFNLLSNASKFTKDGRILLKVVRESDARHEYLLFIVEDTGIGISKEQLKRIFEPFRQADTSTTRVYGGTGLGLTISKRFCEMMGGSIMVDSEPGQGTRFVVKLPSVTEVIENDEIQRPRLSGPVSSQYSPGTIDEERRKRTSRILVADSHVTASKKLVTLLGKLAFDVRLAETDPQACELADSYEPDIIIVEAEMPDVETWHTLRTLRSNENLHAVPIIVHTTIMDEPMAYELGASEFIAKPADEDSLVSAIRKWLRSRAARQTEQQESSQ